jgi:hypothetical protein
MNSVFCNTHHFRNFMNFDSSIFPYQTFDNDITVISLWGPWSASVFLWIVSQCRLAIFKFLVPHRHFLWAENILGVNTNLWWNSLTHTFRLQKFDHHEDPKFGIIFNSTCYFVHLYSLDWKGINRQIVMEFQQNWLKREVKCYFLRSTRWLILLE